MAFYDAFVVVCSKEVLWSVRGWRPEHICEKCKCALDVRGDHLEYNGPALRKKHDVVGTLDLALLWSKEAVSILRVAATPVNVRAIAGLDMFLVEPLCELKFNSAARQTQFLDECSRCNRFSEIIGATPAYLMEAAQEEIGVYRTDLCFGTRSNKYPLFLVTEKLKKLLEAAKVQPVVYKKCIIAER